MCLRSPQGTFNSHKPELFHFNPRSNIGARVCSCLIVSRLLNSQRQKRHLCDPFVKDRHTFHQAFTDICTAPRSSQKAFFHLFATLFRQHSSGISLVRPKFSTRDILLQMCPPDIQHTSKDNSEHKGALIFKDLVRKTLISAAHLFGLFARVPLQGQGRTSQGRTFSCL